MQRRTTTSREMIWLRDFSWRYFTLTGDIDAYLLYKQHEELFPDWDEVPADLDEEPYPE